MASSDKKIAEGLEHIRQAEKCIKTSFFSRTPDRDGAVAEYNKAAVAFKIARAYDQATNAHLNCAEIEKDMKSYFHSGKSWEAAAMCQKELKEWKKAGEYIEQAAELFLEHGTPDTGALVLDKGAKMLEPVLPDRAIELYKRAADIYNAEDNARTCAEALGKAGRLLVRQKRLEEAAEALQTEMDMLSRTGNLALVFKRSMPFVLIRLHQGDWVAADKAFQSCAKYEGFATSEEAQLVGNVLNYYDQCDGDTVAKLCKNPLFKYLDNDYAKLARDLQVPGGGSKKAPAPSDGGGEDQGTAPAEEEDDLSGLL